MNRPRPVPSSDPVANFVNNCGKNSGSIPVPLSLILTITSLPLSPFFDVVVVMLMVPSFVNLMALFTRLHIT
jgi:hypothetical protein